MPSILKIEGISQHFPGVQALVIGGDPESPGISGRSARLSGVTVESSNGPVKTLWVIREPRPANHQSLLNMWLLWALLSALFAGLTAVFAKIGVVAINSNLATAIRTTIILVFTWIIAFSSSQPADLLRLPFRSWLFLFLSAVATGLSWLCYFRALQIGEVAKVAPIDKLSVVVAITISVLFLGERLSVREGFGVGLIVCGALFLAWK